MWVLSWLLLTVLLAQPSIPLAFLKLLIGMQRCYLADCNEYIAEKHAVVMLDLPVAATSSTDDGCGNRAVQEGPAGA